MCVFSSRCVLGDDSPQEGNGLGSSGTCPFTVGLHEEEYGKMCLVLCNRFIYRETLLPTIIPLVLHLCSSISPATFCPICNLLPNHSLPSLLLLLLISPASTLPIYALHLILPWPVNIFSASPRQLWDLMFFWPCIMNWLYINY